MKTANIGKNLKELRTKQGLTQVMLAEKLSVSQGTVALWESGRAIPKSDKLPQIAQVLECTIDDFFKESI